MPFICSRGLTLVASYVIAVLTKAKANAAV
jgi:hypothetical protein